LPQFGYDVGLAAVKSCVGAGGKMYTDETLESGTLNS
jgi:hypothetical protein